MLSCFRLVVSAFGQHALSPGTKDPKELFVAKLCQTKMDLRERAFLLVTCLFYAPFLIISSPIFTRVHVLVTVKCLCALLLPVTPQLKRPG